MRTMIATAALFCAVGLAGEARAATATLADLLGGGSLTEADVVFSGFSFEDFFDSEQPFPGDRPVSADQIALSTSSTATSVTLSVTVSPAISIADADASGLDHIFEFFLDFTASVVAPSGRVIETVALGSGDLFATGAGVAEVTYLRGASEIALFEDPAAGDSQIADQTAVTPAAILALMGQIEGETGRGDSAGLSTFALTIGLDRALPPSVIPLPATAALLLGGLCALGLATRRRRG